MYTKYKVRLYVKECIKAYWGKKMIKENISSLIKTEFSTKTCSCKTIELTGSVNIRGLMEIPLDATVREIVYGIGGGISGDREFKAVQLGGASGVCLNSNYLDLTLDSESLKKSVLLAGWRA